MPYKDDITRRKARLKSYQKRKDKILKQERRYRAENPQAYRNTKLKHRYGLSQEEFKNLLDIQNGLCALCGDRAAIDVDHCHKTHKVRALLCRKCNVGLGFFEDSIERLTDAIAYLQKFIT